MTTIPLVLLAAAAVGVDAGWTEHEQGGYEYILQLSPEEVDSLRAGGEFGCDLPAHNGSIRSIKVVVGRGPVNNHGIPLPEDASTAFKPPLDSASARSAQAGGNGVTGANPRGERYPAPNIFGGQSSQNTSGARDKDKDDSAAETPVAEQRDDPYYLGKTRDARTAAEKVASEVDKGSSFFPNTSDDPAPEDEPAKTSNAKTDPPTDNAAGATSDEEPARAHEPDEFVVSKFWYFTAWILVFIVGGAFGYVAFLAIDFRNRYLELLRDLDTSAEEPGEAPSRREEDAVQEEEEEAEEEPEREQFARSSNGYSNRHGHRRRERHEEAYEDE